MKSLPKIPIFFMFMFCTTPSLVSAFDNNVTHPFIIDRVVNGDMSKPSLLIQAEGGVSFYEEVREYSPVIRLGSKDEDGWSYLSELLGKYQRDDSYMTDEMVG